MASNRKKTETATLEQSRVALENVETQPQISTVMTEFEYGPEKIAEGKTVLAETEQVYQKNKTEDDETSAAYKSFSTIKSQLQDRYTRDRRKARVAYRKDSVTADRLGILGNKPKAYVRWLENVIKFYSSALADTDVQAKLARFKITPEYLTETEALISPLKTARAEYLREVGESQDATKAKDQALAKLDDWMREFYDVAEIALEDHPQLLESLGKFVRS